MLTAKEIEQVYWVCLTPAEARFILKKQAVLGLLNDECYSIISKLESARPEHPKRREALEEVAEAARHLNMYFDDPDWIVDDDASRFMAARERLRALEGK